MKLQYLNIFYWFRLASFRYGICTACALATGLISGVMLQALNNKFSPILLDVEEALSFALILFGLSFIIILLVLTVQNIYSIKSIFAPLLFNCLLTSFLTVLISFQFDAYTYAIVVGVVIGFIVGYLLCKIPKLFNNGL